MKAHLHPLGVRPAAVKGGGDAIFPGMMNRPGALFAGDKPAGHSGVEPVGFLSALVQAMRQMRVNGDQKSSRP